jgi:hypothetical protein
VQIAWAIRPGNAREALEFLIPLESNASAFDECPEEQKVSRRLGIAVVSGVRRKRSHG